jgi:hypothetical protein
MTTGSELLRALALFSESPSAEHRPMADLIGLPEPPSREVYTHVLEFNLYPYASVYLGPEGMLGGEARDRIAGFWRAVGYEVPQEPDHLASLVGLYASLREAEMTEPDQARRLLRREARLALLWEHLLPWLPLYLTKVQEHGAFFEAWGALFLTALREQVEDVPAALPAHLAVSRELAHDDDIVPALLAPVRSGMVITRADLMAIGSDLGLGVRVGERAFILRSLFSQEPEAVADRLGVEAEMWRARHHGMRRQLGVIAEHHEERAQAAAALLFHRSAAAGEVVAGGSRG